MASKDRLHIVLLGERNIGKTSLMHLLCGKNLSKPSVTLGMEFHCVEAQAHGQTFKLLFLDPAGGRLYTAYVKCCVRRVHALFLVYDVRDRDSFHSIQKWLDLATESCEHPIGTIALIGNGSDAEPSQRVISHEEGAELAQRIGASFFETSALKNEGVEDVKNWLQNQLLSCIADYYFVVWSDVANYIPPRQSLWDWLMPRTSHYKNIALAKPPHKHVE